MTKRMPLGFMIAIIIVAIAVTFAVTYKIALDNFNNKVIDLNQRQEMYTKLSTVDQEVRAKYYTELDNDAVTDGTIEGYIAALNDEQSAYLTKEEYKEELSRQNQVDANDVSSLLLSNEVGYIKINNFTVGTDARFKTQLTNLQNNGVKSIIIDLRNNSGENVNSAVASVDTLINSGNLLSEQYKDGSKELIASADGDASQIPVCVLTNESTKLGAEIFAADIKESGRGKVCGTTTAGIGNNAEIYPLSDGTAIKLSVATYLTQSNSSFNNIGVKPDVEVVLSQDQKKAYDEGKLSTKDDPVVQEAIKQLTA